MSIRINRVYTRSGDDGTTGLVGGSRVKKSHARVAAIGDIDESNAALGLVKEEITSKTSELSALLERLQQELFDIGSEVATPAEGAYRGMWRVEGTHVAELERLCDCYGEKLPELKSFILPGGSKLAAALHYARTVIRRTERSLLLLKEAGSGGNAAADELRPEVLRYINRLSDLLFVLARWSLVQEGKSAPPWVQAKDRKSPA